MILTNVLVGIEDEGQLVAVSFTALVLNELVMIALEIYTWHKYMI
jgi:phospholipid-translocating ATPase